MAQTERTARDTSSNASPQLALQHGLLRKVSPALNTLSLLVVAAVVAHGTLPTVVVVVVLVAI
jgi:hypothetical protein